jgi:FKBP-type peptidyl-prolyl cis-trans isomerase SlyD
MAPVMVLKEHNVEALVAGGMGMRPLAGFQQVGIDVFHKDQSQTVRDAVQLFVDGKANKFDEAQTCGGGGGGCGGHGHDHDHHHHEVKREAIEGPKDVRDGRVVSFDYTLLNRAGEILDSTAESGPAQFLCGHSGVLPKLEKALEGLEPGAKLKVELNAVDAFGERDESMIIEVPRAQLPPQVQPGVAVHGQQPDGAVAMFRVVEVNDETARLDANHPLAGQDLIFEVTIVDVEAATAEELAHGHIH